MFHPESQGGLYSEGGGLGRSQEDGGCTGAGERIPPYRSGEDSNADTLAAQAPRLFLVRVLTLGESNGTSRIFSPAQSGHIRALAAERGSQDFSAPTQVLVLLSGVALRAVYNRCVSCVLGTRDSPGKVLAPRLPSMPSLLPSFS